MNRKSIVKQINRDTMLSCIYPSDIETIIKTLLNIIKTGTKQEQLQASKVVLEYTIGKPKQVDTKLDDRDNHITIVSRFVENPQLNNE